MHPQYSNNFFKAAATANFFEKLTSALTVIKNNKSLIAGKVYSAIVSGEVALKPFAEMTERDFFHIKKGLQILRNIELPDLFPPAADTVKQIESMAQGVLLTPNIYLNSEMSTADLALTIVHEVAHYLNTACYEIEIEKARAIAPYLNEVRSVMAEKMFSKQFCLTRSDIKRVHEKVCAIYPQFVLPKQNMAEIGYVFSSYDAPRI
ncbi:hypothetical protein NKV53_11245 [Legionella sp. 27cVA30]|uniref:hypothetical protein n=1 Tax=Legionella sp. 27cVA30 TaxID=2905657 RepID=UPI00209E381C|nr:hypothetical protein [Legionella sp. 27cVA30]MCP0914902.1 hypothetical protein [Legionella sp. 27cVA30]